MNGENSRPIGTYREDCSICKRSFELFADKVSIQGKNRQGEFVHHIPLEHLAPDIGSRVLPNPNARYPAFSFVCLLAAFAIVISLLGGSAEPGAMAIIVAVITLLVASGLTTLWMRTRKIRTYTFMNTQGALVLDLIEFGPEKENCRAFAELVSQTIKNLRGL